MAQNEKTNQTKTKTAQKAANTPKKAANTLARYEVDCVAVPHPSMGGANRFKEAVAKIFANEK